MIVENRPGASSQIAGELVAKGPPDGHVLMHDDADADDLDDDREEDIPRHPEGLRARFADARRALLILAVNPSLPVRSVKELIALARARPGELNYASGGVGTTLHLGGELLKTMARLKIVHVPYKGEAPAIIDVIAGHMPVSFSNVTACDALRAGRQAAGACRDRAAAHARRPRHAHHGGIGLPGFEVVGFFGVLAPAATPREIVTRLNGEIDKALARPDTRSASRPRRWIPAT